MEELFTLTVSICSPGGRTETFTNVTLQDKPRRIDAYWKRSRRCAPGRRPRSVRPSPSLDDAVKIENGESDLVGDAVANAERSMATVKPTSIDPKEWKAAQDKLDKAVRSRARSADDTRSARNGRRLRRRAAPTPKGLYALENLFTFGGIFQFALHSA